MSKPSEKDVQVIRETVQLLETQLLEALDRNLSHFSITNVG